MGICVSADRTHGHLASAGWFPYRTDIGYMKVNQVTECVQSCHEQSVGQQPFIHQRRGQGRPFPAVVAVLKDRWRLVSVL